MSTTPPPISYRKELHTSDETCADNACKIYFSVVTAFGFSICSDFIDVTILAVCMLLRSYNEVIAYGA